MKIEKEKKRKEKKGRLEMIALPLKLRQRRKETLKMVRNKRIPRHRAGRRALLAPPPTISDSLYIYIYMYMYIVDSCCFWRKRERAKNIMVVNGGEGEE